MSRNNKGSFLAIAAVSVLILGQQGECRERGFSYTQSVIQNNLNTKRQQLNAEITAKLASGQLSTSEAASLRDRVDRLADLQLTYSEDSALNERETNHLVNGYAQITADMNNFVSTPNRFSRGGYRWNSRANRFYRNSMARSLAQRIDRGVADGTITPREAERLHDRYLSAGPRADMRFAELNSILNRMQSVRSAHTRFRHWD
jgi:hypothetical protein